MSLACLPKNNLFALAKLALSRDGSFIDTLYQQITAEIAESGACPVSYIFSLGWIGGASAYAKLLELASLKDNVSVACSAFVLGQLDEIASHSVLSQLSTSRDHLISNVAKLAIYWGGGNHCTITTDEASSCSFKNFLYPYESLSTAPLKNIKNSCAKDRNISIIGVSGSGKTSILTSLPNSTSRVTIDLDEVVEANTGYDLSTIFLRFGETVFRALECSILLDCLNKPGQKIIALGGGSAIKHCTSNLIRNNSFIIYLSASYTTIQERLRHSINTGGDNKAAKVLLDILPDAFHKLLYYYRTPFFSALADAIIETDELSQAACIDLIIQIITAE